MLYGIILICSTSINPQWCDQTTALRYERAPGGHALPFTCMRDAQAWAAEHELIQTEGEYAKVVCTRHSFGHRVG